MSIPIGGTPPAPDPNVDYVVLEYDIGGRPLHLGLYVDKLGDLTTTSGNPDYNYASSGTFFGIETLSNEPTLQQTIVNLLASVKRLYDNTVNFSIKSVWKRDGGGTLQEVFPTAALGAEAGTGGSLSPAVVTPLSSEPGCWLEHILTTRTGHGGKFRMSFVGADPLTYVKPMAVVGNASGNTFERIVHYVTSADCRIMGHAGGRPMSQFRLHSTPNAKLRRSFKFA